MTFQPIPGFTKDENQWMFEVYKSSPELYAIGVREYQDIVREMNMGGLGIDWGGIFAKVSSAVSNAAPALLQLKAQKDALSVQKKQMAQQSAIQNQALQQSLAADLEAQQYARAMELQQQQQKLASPIGGIPQWAPIAALIGLLGYMALKRK